MVALLGGSLVKMILTRMIFTHCRIEGRLFFCPFWRFLGTGSCADSPRQ